MRSKLIENAYELDHLEIRRISGPFGWVLGSLGSSLGLKPMREAAKNGALSPNNPPHLSEGPYGLFHMLGLYLSLKIITLSMHSLHCKRREHFSLRVALL